MDDLDRSAALATLAADAADHRGLTSTWASIVDDAYATVVVLQGVAAVGRAGAWDREMSGPRDELHRGIEVLADPVISADREARDSLEEALRQLHSELHVEVSLDRMLVRLQCMDDTSVRELLEGVQVSLLAMQVQQAIADGAVQGSEGEVMAVVSPGEPGGLTDGTGTEVGMLRVALEEFLPRGVAAGRSAAEEGDSAGEMLDTLAEFGGDVVPVATLAMAGAELAWSWARGGDVGVVVDRMRGRAGRAAVLNAVAQGVGMVTGLDQAKVAIVATGHLGTAAVDRVDRELVGSIAHVRSCRRALAGLASDAGAVP
jgi:hypothetical protein